MALAQVDELCRQVMFVSVQIGEDRGDCAYRGAASPVGDSWTIASGPPSVAGTPSSTGREAVFVGAPVDGQANTSTSTLSAR